MGVLPGTAVQLELYHQACEHGSGDSHASVTRSVCPDARCCILKARRTSLQEAGGVLDGKFEFVPHACILVEKHAIVAVLE